MSHLRASESRSALVLRRARERAAIRSRIKTALGQPEWKQLADEARRNDERFGLRDLDPEVVRIIDETAEYTQTPAVRIAALCDAVDYVVDCGVPGAIVECGIWRGGGLMAAMLRLRQLSSMDRPIFGYDTFAGMTPPSEKDFDANGDSILARWKREHGQSSSERPDNLAPGTDRVAVAALLGSLGYPCKLIRLVEGPVEETIPGIAPGRIAILRLDTDFYESTLHELRYLYPSLAVGGVLIIDDYGELAGARAATDEYLAGERVFLQRVDYGARILIKQHP